MEKKKFNQTMECFKMLAAIFVVMLHYPFPGRIGTTINCLARFAVPMFFAVSGYFSYGVNGSRMAKRIIHILKLNIVGTVIYALWYVYVLMKIGNVNIPDLLEMKLSPTNIVKWLFINVNPFAGHMWYLSALLTCYILLWVYAKFFDGKKINYTPLYVVGFCLMTLQFVLSTCSATAGMNVPYLVYRNGLLFGLPMMILGVFINEHGDRITENFKLTPVKSFAVMILGAILSLLQWKGLGKTEMPVGALVTVVFLMLFMSSHPQVPFLGKYFGGVIRHFGNVSLMVYISHILFGNMIVLFSAENEKILAIREDGYLNPIAIILLSVLAGVIYALLLFCFNKVKKLIFKETQL